MTRVPKYRAVADDLADRIRRGQYRPGQPLPAQRLLRAEFGVTLMTLRQALNVLGDAGLVIRQPGRGTFVTPPPAAYRMETLRSLSDELRAQGVEVVTEVLGTRLVRPPRGVVAAGDLAPNARALRLERLRHVDGLPLVRQVSWIPSPLAEAIRGVDFTTTALYAALAQVCDATVASASERVRTGLLSTEMYGLLRRPAGTPVFLSDRVTRGVDATTLVVEEAIMIGDRLRIHTDRVATALSLSWTLVAAAR